MIRIILLMLSLTVMADNEIFINQSGNNASIDLEQLGSGNLIGGDDAISGTMTKAIFSGTGWTLDINQIGSSNKFLTDGMYGDNFTGFYEFDGDSNEFEWSMDTTGLNGADYVNVNVDVTGSFNTADVDLGETAEVSYLDLDWTILGDSNEIEFDLDSAYATNFMDINGDSNELTFEGSGYGASSSDAGYFYLDLDGDSNVFSITQSSTLARDWLKIESNVSNGNICIVQSDGGTTTSC
mgnify:CR=1 FL=1|jgi:hypothetical protein|tara:strand:+ start:2020 stop:2736 length:717 start_codon:yes stop_codon:yes gene_type:complete